MEGTAQIWIECILSLSLKKKKKKKKILAMNRICEILVPQPRIKPLHLALDVWSLNHWTSSKVPFMRFFSFSLTYLCFAAMQPFIINVIFLILIFFFLLSGKKHSRDITESSWSISTCPPDNLNRMQFPKDWKLHEKTECQWEELNQWTVSWEWRYQGNPGAWSYK